MDVNRTALRILEQEAYGIRARIDALYPFALQMPMVAAANVPQDAQAAVEQHMIATREKLRRLVLDFLGQLKRLPPTPEAVCQAQRRYALLKLYFQAGLSHFDIFADVLAQRSQHGMGVWLAGLDMAAADGLDLPDYYRRPPVICYVDRGHGAAIRRARTRLPGGGENPVAIVRVPRERMVGTGIASSLFHEVGHQGAALLDLVNSLKRAMTERFRTGADLPPVWRVWDRWISEIVADLWSVSRVGLAATAGLISVVSLPKAFVFRLSLEDPHPAPWLRVKLSAAMGNALYPNGNWDAMASVWERLYPKTLMSPQQREVFATLEAGVPELVGFLLAHRPARLRGNTLGEVLRLPGRDAASLRATWQRWQASPALIRSARPTLAFAVLGQARADGRLDAAAEMRTISSLLERWALGNYRPYAIRAARTPTQLAA